MDCNLEVDFMDVSSYGNESNEAAVRILKDLGQSVKDRHVIIVEDIIDTGRTLNTWLSIKTPPSSKCKSGDFIR